MSDNRDKEGKVPIEFSNFDQSSKSKNTDRQKEHNQLKTPDWNLLGSWVKRPDWFERSWNFFFRRIVPLLIAIWICVYLYVALNSHYRETAAKKTITGNYQVNTREFTIRILSDGTFFEEWNFGHGSSLQYRRLKGNWEVEAPFGGGLTLILTSGNGSTNVYKRLTIRDDGTLAMHTSMGGLVLTKQKK